MRDPVVFDVDMLLRRKSLSVYHGSEERAEPQSRSFSAGSAWGFVSGYFTDFASAFVVAVVSAFTAAARASCAGYA